MKCPFCNRNLHKGEDGMYSHLDYMTECKGRLFDGSKELWQELIRTRKALDIAVDALKDNLSQANFTQMLDASRFHCIRTKCEFALAEIKALEQKEQQ
jgi:hypothetical protein